MGVPFQSLNMNNILQKITWILLISGLKSFVITQEDSSVTEVVNELFNGTDGIYEVLEMFEGSSDAVQDKLSENLSAFLTHLFTQAYNEETEFNYQVQQEIIDKLEEFGGFESIVKSLEEVGIEFDETWNFESGNNKQIEDSEEITPQPVTESGKLESSSDALKFSILTIICFS